MVSDVIGSQTDLVDLRGSRPFRFAADDRLPGEVLLPCLTMTKMTSRVRKTAKVADAGRKTLLPDFACHHKAIGRDFSPVDTRGLRLADACSTWAV